MSFDQFEGVVVSDTTVEERLKIVDELHKLFETDAKPVVSKVNP